VAAVPLVLVMLLADVILVRCLLHRRVENHQVAEQDHPWAKLSQMHRSRFDLRAIAIASDFWPHYWVVSEDCRIAASRLMVVRPNR
jgi:hypothetical protein